MSPGYVLYRVGIEEVPTFRVAASLALHEPLDEAALFRRKAFHTQVQGEGVSKRFFNEPVSGMPVGELVVMPFPDVEISVREFVQDSLRQQRRGVRRIIGRVSLDLVHPNEDSLGDERLVGDVDAEPVDQEL